MEKMEKKQLIFIWSEGNFGAMAFLNSVFSLDEEKKNSILSKLDEMKSIRGSNAYVLWSDLCGKNLAKVQKLCENCPSEILENACSRQDYSGIKLVSNYLV